MARAIRRTACWHLMFPSALILWPSLLSARTVFASAFGQPAIKPQWAHVTVPIIKMTAHACSTTMMVLHHDVATLTLISCDPVPDRSLQLAPSPPQNIQMPSNPLSPNMLTISLHPHPHLSAFLMQHANCTALHALCVSAERERCACHLIMGYGSSNIHRPRRKREKRG